MFSENEAERIALFEAFTDAPNGDVFLEFDRGIRFTERECRQIFKDVCGAENAAQFQALPKKERDDGIRSAKKRGLSIRQISRLTGVSFGLVRRK
jgi:hypothetical protein